MFSGSRKTYPFKMIQHSNQVAKLKEGKDNKYCHFLKFGRTFLFFSVSLFNPEGITSVCIDLC